MAEKSSSRIRYDDIVSAVHADPANAEPMVMLAGYLGKSPEDGNLRIYPDASLGHWYEVAEGDVVHSRPLSDSALGGSNVWLKASAKITPGVATAPRPAEGEEGSEGDAAAQALPDTGVFNPLATIHPTLWTQIGCHTQLPGCGTGTIHPTLWTQIACPTQNPACGPGTIHPTIWTQIGCSTQAGCIETISCLPPGLEAQAYAARPHTAGVGCPDTISCTPHHISLPGCVHTGGVGCPDTVSCTPYHISVPGCLPPRTIGCPVLSVPGCLPPHTLGCPVLSIPGCLPPRTIGCPVLSVPGCLPPPTLGCPVLSVPGCLPPPTLGCPQPTLGCPQAIGNTAATVCTQYGCPHPGNTAATVCTQFGCQHPGGEAQAAPAAQVAASSVWGCSMICSVFVTCSPLCAREAAPAQAYPVSVPGHCPTVGPQCQLLSAPPHCPTVAPPCGLLSAPPHCPMPPTHMLGCPSTHTCPPTNMPGCPSSHAGCPPHGGYATFPFCP